MTMATETLTIRLPVQAANRLRRIAEIAQRPIDEVVAETLQSTLPPYWMICRLHSKPIWLNWRHGRMKHYDSRFLRSSISGALSVTMIYFIAFRLLCIVCVATRRLSEKR